MDQKRILKPIRFPGYLQSIIVLKRWNQSILKEINPEYTLEGLMLKQKLQYFGYLMWRTDSLEKTLMLGKIEDRRRRGWLNGVTTLWTWVWASSGSWWWTGNPGMLQSMGSQRVGQDWEVNRWRLESVGLCHMTSTLDFTLLPWESLEIKLKLLAIQ